MRILGLILAGGQGRRLGGVDKAFQPVGGVACLTRVHARLGPQCDALAASVVAPDGAWRATGLRLIEDCGAPHHDGPLAGILAGLVAAEADGFDALLTVPVDTPFIPADLAMRLAQALTQAQADFAIAESAGEHHPVIGLWPVAIRAAVDAAFAEGLRAPRRLNRVLRPATATWPTDPYDPFLNLNRPEDRAQLDAIAAGVQADRAIGG